MTTFALLATLGLAHSTPPTLNPASSTSICSEEKSFGCLSNERYVEYVMPMDRSTETDRCPRRPKKNQKVGRQQQDDSSKSKQSLPLISCNDYFMIFLDFLPVF